MFDIEKQAIERQKIQLEAIKLFRANTHCLFSWATGCGKSLATIKCIEDFEPSLVLILVKETTHEQNWRDEFVKHGFSELLNRVEFYCYASLHKLQGAVYEVVVNDEVHALSTLREDYLQTIKFEKMISLSATVPEEVKVRLKQISPYYEYNIPISEAIERGILPEPTIYVIPVELNDKEAKYTFKTKKGEVKLTAKEYYKRLEANIEYWKERYLDKYEPFAEKKWLFGAINRKRWMAEYKTEILRRLVELVKNKRFICFCGSLAQAKLLGAKNSIHSKNTKQKNEEVLNDFNTLKTNLLFTCQMLTEGQNLVNIECAIISQLDSKDRTFIQRMGRSLRGENPEIYIIYIKNTVDENYFLNIKEIFQNFQIADLIIN